MEAIFARPPKLVELSHCVGRQMLEDYYLSYVTKQNLDALKFRECLSPTETGIID